MTQMRRRWKTASKDDGIQQKSLDNYMSDLITIR